MTVRQIFLALAGVTFASACDPGYTRVTNNYPEPIRLEIYTNASQQPSEITLTPGQSILYRDPRISVQSIKVTEPDGHIKYYDSMALEKAAAGRQGMETIQWSVRREGAFASSN
jgi:hypothetical protein